MIRIKCPKCASALTFDDEEAGQVGDCEECGARLRIPAKKSGSPPSKRDEVEDEGEDDEDQESAGDKQPAKKVSKGKASSGLSPEIKSHIMTGLAFLPAIILLGIGSIFINRLGLIVASVSIILMLFCGLMVARDAMSDSTGKFLMVLLLPPYFLFYAISNWQRAQQFVVTYVGFGLLAAACWGGMTLNGERALDRRKRIREEITKPITMLPPVNRPEYAAHRQPPNPRG